MIQENSLWFCILSVLRKLRTDRENRLVSRLVRVDSY